MKILIEVVKAAQAIKQSSNQASIAKHGHVRCAPLETL
jgi:hypothetical protein